MKNLILCMLVFTANLARAEEAIDSLRRPGPEFHSGTVYLTQSGLRPLEGCGSHTQLVLDTGNIVGNFAYFEEQMTQTSVCEIMILSNPRMVLIEHMEEAGCGSVRYIGYWYGEDAAKVTITDHRLRLCLDMLANYVTVEFEFLNTGTKKTLRTYF